MPVEDALTYVRDASSVQGIRGFSFTGGEPFTAYNSLCRVMEEIGKRSLQARVVTNCFWATSSEEARRLLQPLVQNGLSELSVSYDEVHREFVSQTCVSIAIQAALSLGLKVVVSTTTLTGDIEDHMRRIEHELALPSDENLYVMPGYIVPRGRAEASFAPASYCYADEAQAEGRRLREPCPHVIREPIITPSGDVAACCTPSTATRIGFMRSFVVGNAKRRPLPDLLHDLENDLLFNIIMLDGPWRLLQTLRKTSSSITQRTAYVNICDLCSHLLSSTSAIKQLLRELRGAELDIAARKLHLEVLANGDFDDYIGLKAGVCRMRPQR